MDIKPLKDANIQKLVSILTDTAKISRACETLNYATGYKPLNDLDKEDFRKAEKLLADIYVELEKKNVSNRCIRRL